MRSVRMDVGSGNRTIGYPTLIDSYAVLPTDTWHVIRVRDRNRILMAAVCVRRDLHVNCRTVLPITTNRIVIVEISKIGSGSGL